MECGLRLAPVCVRQVRVTSPHSPLQPLGRCRRSIRNLFPDVWWMCLCEDRFTEPWPQSIQGRFRRESLLECGLRLAPVCVRQVRVTSPHSPQALNGPLVSLNGPLGSPNGGSSEIGWWWGVSSFSPPSEGITVGCVCAGCIPSEKILQEMEVKNKFCLSVHLPLQGPCPPLEPPLETL